MRVAFPSTLQSSGTISFLVHPAQVDAWRAFAAVMTRFRYEIRENASGTANCRNIDSRPFGDTSLHAHLSAIDLNPLKNTRSNTDQPKDLQKALAAIRTKRGSTVFRNLPDDRMHWQINCSRDSLATGIDDSTVSGTFSAATASQGTSPDAIPDFESETAMDKESWKRVQGALQALSPPLYKDKEIDGIPGPATQTAVRSFEKRMKLKQRGVLGELRKPKSGMWPATRELLFVMAFARRP